MTHLMLFLLAAFVILLIGGLYYAGQEPKSKEDLKHIEFSEEIKEQT